jgi:hypothetical protein
MANSDIWPLACSMGVQDQVHIGTTSMCGVVLCVQAIKGSNFGRQMTGKKDNKKMRKITVFAPTLLFALVLLPLSAAFAGSKPKAGPLTFQNPFGSGYCTATFNLSASGLINETDLTCDSPPQNPWASADVYLQYRPAGKKGNCDASGLVTTQPFITSDPALATYFTLDASYTACVYLVNPVVASGKIDVTGPDGNTTPGVPLAGRYNICVGGTYNAGLTWGDAKYLLLLDGSGNWADALQVPWDYLGSGFGEVQVDQQFVAWGAFNRSHNYCQVFTAATGDQFNLRVFDGITSESPATRVDDGWYTDNPQSDSTLQYLVTYAGQ